MVPSPLPCRGDPASIGEAEAVRPSAREGQSMDEKDDTLENAPSEDLYLRSPAPLSPEPSRVDELTWDAGERDGAGLLYEPLEAGDSEPPAAPRSGPDLADSSSLLFRLA